MEGTVWDSTKVVSVALDASSVKLTTANWHHGNISFITVFATQFSTDTYRRTLDKSKRRKREPWGNQQSLRVADQARYPPLILRGGFQLFLHERPNTAATWIRDYHSWITLAPERPRIGSRHRRQEQTCSSAMKKPSKSPC